MRSIKQVTVFCASSRQVARHHTQAARELGTCLARAGVTVVYGGGNVGSMGTMANAALAAGGRVVGVIPQFMRELEWQHEGLTQLHVVDTMRERKKLMLEGTDAVVALPGGCGTFDELLEAITLKRLGLFVDPIIVVNVSGYFDPLLAALTRAVDDRFMSTEHLDMWRVVDSPTEVLPAIHAAPNWQPEAAAFAVP